jgi:DNA-binding CsgD family transcriptional regulator
VATERSAGHLLAAINAALASTPLEVPSILATATSTLSRFKPATWMAVVMDPNPDTSRVVVADDADPAMAQYVDTFIAAIDRPHHSPTAGLSQQVIESGNPIFRRALSLDELMTEVSPAGSAFMRAHPPPGGRHEVDYLMVPMRVGGAMFGTLSAADWNGRGVLDESDVDWVQTVADRIALSLEHTRLAGAVRENTRRLDLVHSIALAVRQRQDISLFSRVLVEQITSRLEVDAAEFLLLTEGASEMLLHASAGFRSAAPVGHRVPVTSLRLTTDFEPRVELLADIDRGGPNPRGAHFAREDFQTAVAVKVHTRGRLLGALVLYNRSPVEWDRGWLDFFDTVGALVGLAIDQPTRSAIESHGERRGRAPGSDMSDLDLQVLRLVVEGLTNREIAAQVHRSENTIKFHVRHILQRTGVSNRTELARRATREGWI